MLPPPAMRSDVDGVCVWVPFLDDAPFRSGKAHAFVGGDRPDEGGEFARDGDIDDIGWFSGPDEPAVSGAKPHLRLPGDVLDRPRQLFVALEYLDSDPRR